MRLFIGDISENTIKLREDEEHHIIKVIRMSSGDEIFVIDGKGNLIKGSLQIVGKRTKVEIIKVLPKVEKPIDYLHIAIAPTKNIARFEFFIEKAVELGVSEITPLITSNSERKAVKIEKLQKQIESACKQSLQPLFPIVNPLTTFSSYMQQEKGKLFISHCYTEYERTAIAQLLPIKEKITFLIGPEGDFSKKEIEEAYSMGAIGVSLGNNRLRTETAGIFVVASYYYSQPVK